MSFDAPDTDTWLDRPEWEEQAACAGLPQEWFFSDIDWVRGKLEDHLPGLRVCLTCPVLAECREDAVMDPSRDYGIWGGMTTVQRRKERRRRKGLSLT